MFTLLIVASLVALSLGAPQLNVMPRLDGRIVGGKDALIEDYPYQISLLSYGSHNCGGSILSSKHILTAGHCTDGASPSSLTVRVGSSIRNSGGRVIKVQEIHLHPQYNRNMIDYDISILVLAENIQFTTGASQIGLPNKGATPQVGSDAICTGWGALHSGGSMPSQLQSVTVQIVSREDCRNAYGANTITDRMICAGDNVGEKDSCQGDSGGPLVVDGEQVGVVSWGYGCADASYPGVYSNVGGLRDFITEKTGL